jgi:hypothetical protein
MFRRLLPSGRAFRLSSALFAPALIAFSSVARADPLPGDEGYGHDAYHQYYKRQDVFGGHCTCSIGECRATRWRQTQLGSEVGYDVFVNRKWYPLPKDVYRPDERKVPADLRSDPAHVCAYQVNMVLRPRSTIIPCALIFPPPT